MTPIYAPLTINPGTTLNVAGGTLRLFGDSYSDWTGTITLNGGVLDFRSGQYTFGAGAIVTAPGGLLAVTGATVIVGAVFSTWSAGASIAVSSGEFRIVTAQTTFSANTYVTGGNFSILAGTSTFFGVLNVAGGVVYATAPVVITSNTGGLDLQTSGQIYAYNSWTINPSALVCFVRAAGVFTVDEGDVLTIAAPCTMSGGVITGGGTMSITAVFQWNGGTWSLNSTVVSASLFVGGNVYLVNLVSSASFPPRILSTANVRHTTALGSAT